MVHARSIPKAVIELLEEGDYDLLVLGATVSRSGSSQTLGTVADKIVKGAPCPVWVCFSHVDPTKLVLS